MNPTALDLIVRASRPSGLSDSLAWALDLMTRKVERQASEISSLRAHVARLERDLDGVHLANEQLWRERGEAQKIAAGLRLDLAAVRRGETLR